jgi:hypothetical protein
MLTCEQCSAVWSVCIPEFLSAEATRQLTIHYEEQMSRAHCGEFCVFAREAAAYYPTANVANNGVVASATTSSSDDAWERNSQPPARVVPLTGILPTAQLLLLEQASPRALFRNELMKVVTLLKEKMGTVTPQLLIPDEVNAFNPTGCSVVGQQPLMSRLVACLHSDNTTDISTTNITNDLVETSIALVLLGWMPIDETELFTAECSFCLSTFTCIHNNLKRTVVSAHRHYCPYVCGFPIQGQEQTTPLWKTLATRLLLDPNGAKNNKKCPDAAFLQIHALLRNGVAPKFRSTEHLLTETT